MPPGAKQAGRPRWLHRSETGQATVEFALLLPLLITAVLGVVQVGLLVRDQVVVVHAAREAARAAAVDPDPAAAGRAATRVLDDAHTEVRARGRVGEPVEVRVRYRAPTELPLIGPLLPDPVLRADAVMRVER